MKLATSVLGTGPEIRVSYLTRLASGLASHLVWAPVLWSAGCAQSTPSDKEGAVLLAVASEVRPKMDAAFRSYLREGWPSDYEIRLLPDSFPVPEALDAMAQAIGNATAGPVQVACDELAQECTTIPDVAALARFSNLEMVTPDSASVYFELILAPPSGRTDPYSLIDKLFVIRREGGWVCVGSAILQES